MSYSFNIRADNHTAAHAALSRQLDQVVEQHPVHSTDRHQVEEATHKLLYLLGTPVDGEEISLSVSGSICKFDDTGRVTSASLSIHASVLSKVGS